MNAKEKTYCPQMNTDKHRYFLAVAYGETNSKRFYLCLSALTCMDALMSQAHGAQERPSVDKIVFLYPSAHLKNTIPNKAG